MGPRFEDLHDVERRPARDFIHTTMNPDGSRQTSLFLPDEQTSIEIIERDGQLVALLEFFGDDE